MFSLKEEIKAIKVILIGSCVLLFALIVISIFYYGNSTLLGNFYNPNNDDVKFIRSAWNLVQTGNYTFHRPPEATVFMMPGLPYTLAALMGMFGEFGGITALRLLQAVVQVLSLLLIFFTARKLFNSKVGIIAVILDLFCISEIWIPNLILTETFFKFFVLLMVFFSIYALETGKKRYYALGGLFLALATMFRPTIVIYPVLILIMWIIKKVKFKDAIKYTAVVIGVFAIMLSPWWIRNYSIFHRFIPLTLATGNPMLQGTFINYDQGNNSVNDLLYSNYSIKAPSLTEIQKNDLEISLSKYRISVLLPQQPMKFIMWYTVGKGWIQINSPFYWKEIFGESYGVALIYYFVVLGSAILGIITYLANKNKNKNKLAILPIILIVYFILAYLPFFTMCRYFYPAMPYVIIFAAYFILISYSKIKKSLEKKNF